jgi:iron complex outermembrane receptor protein
VGWLRVGSEASRWTSVHADYLTPTGLVETRNAGNARNLGLDLTLGWHADALFGLSGGVLVQHPRIDPVQAFTVSRDRRLPVVPDLAARAEADVAGDLQSWRLSGTLRGSYRGEARLSFDPRLDRENGPAATLELTTTAARDGWEVHVTLDNYRDTRADSFALATPSPPLQHRPAAQQPGLSPTSPGSGDAAIAGLRFSFAPPPAGIGGGDDNALTNNPDHPVGAAQS